MNLTLHKQTNNLTLNTDKGSFVLSRLNYDGAKAAADSLSKTERIPHKDWEMLLKAECYQALTQWEHEIRGKDCWNADITAQWQSLPAVKETVTAYISKTIHLLDSFFNDVDAFVAASYHGPLSLEVKSRMDNCVEIEATGENGVRRTATCELTSISAASAYGRRWEATEDADIINDLQAIKQRNKVRAEAYAKDACVYVCKDLTEQLHPELNFRYLNSQGAPHQAYSSLLSGYCSQLTKELNANWQFKYQMVSFQTIVNKALDEAAESYVQAA